MPPSLATWEDAEVSKHKFPRALSWGQADRFSRGGECFHAAPRVTSASMQDTHNLVEVMAARYIHLLCDS
jgi:hypothetical protein